MINRKIFERTVSLIISDRNAGFCLCVIWIILITTGCVSVHEKNGFLNNEAIHETEQQVIIKGRIEIESEKVFNKEVIIYPEAFIKTTTQGKLIFQKPVTILGTSQVFDINAHLEFGKGCVGRLNVCWFGAKGYDREDDTRAFNSTLALAGRLENSVNLLIPMGQYYISTPIVVENTNGLNKSINLIGEGMSNSTNDGSSMIWNGTPGGSMILMRNNYLNTVQSLDFAAEPGHEVQSNIELRYQIYQMEFRDCSFSGSAGKGSCNINLNSGQSDQVSEISFHNCIFRGKTDDNRTWLTESAIRGGKANTKNIFFEKCSFLGYTEAAINLEVAELLHVNHCTFSHNNIDMVCLLCSTLATSNYSERSKGFFMSTNSGNLAFTTLINNYFDGHPDADLVIPNGSGSLVLINNNFGGNGGEDSVNRIQWVPKNISSIYSLGNFFRNDNPDQSPFVFPEHNPFNFHSEGDKVGKDGGNCIKWKDSQ